MIHPPKQVFFLIQHQFKTCSNVMLIYPEETYSLYVLAYIVLSASSMFLDQTSCGKPTAINRSIHQPFQLVVVLHHPSHEGILKCHKPKRWFTNIINSKQKQSCSYSYQTKTRVIAFQGFNIVIFKRVFTRFTVVLTQFFWGVDQMSPAQKHHKPKQSLYQK